MSDLDRLFYWRGVAPDFYNFRGQLTEVPLDNRLQILSAMGVDCSSPEKIHQAAYELDVKPWQSWLKPLLLARGRAQIEINFHPSQLQQSFDWRLHKPCGALSGAFVPEELPETGDYSDAGVRYSRRALSLPLETFGYYRFHLHSEDSSESSLVAFAPMQCYQPEWLSSTEKLWGFVVQLYALRSESDWGIGDFSDLEELIDAAAKQGADLIGLNPFHALQSNLNSDISPYSPSDRRFLNPLYIDVEKVEQFKPAFINKTLAKRIDLLRKCDEVDYVGVRSAKYPVLEKCFVEFITAGSRELQLSFVEYTSRFGQSLFDFCHYEQDNSWAFRKSPVVVKRCHGILKCLLPGVFRAELQGEDVGAAFHMYLQFVADRQLQQVQELATARGMKVGLVRDLAVGASGYGAEVKTNSEYFCESVSIGAPPDPMALTGQNWGMPPLDPAALKSSGFAHYIDLLRANMAHCGALRIDHAMSMMRLWWCPPGEDADRGCYIYYPFEEMLTLLCLESHLNQCAIIGEDLGVVPDDFRHHIAQAGVISNKVFYFEKISDVQFKHPSEYMPMSLAMITNHDVPTLCSWWETSDLYLRKSLDLLEKHIEFSHLLEDRRREKQSLLQLLDMENLLPPGWTADSVDNTMDFSLVRSIVLLMAKTSAKLLVLQLEDLMQMDAPVNVPGTYNQYPNWKRKLAQTTSTLFAAADVQTLLSELACTRNADK